MAVARKKPAEPSCPLWLATYGDMVTNVLVFFVLLLSMSEIKKDEKFVDFMQALQEAFGYRGGLEQIPLETQLDVKNVPLAQMLVIPIDPHQMSQSPDKGTRAKHHNVSYVRPPDRYPQAGKVTFTELSAEISPEDRQMLSEYAATLKGLRTQIEVRGHCNPRPTDGSPYHNHFDLAYARAAAVKDVLLANGIEPERIVVVAAGTNEPVTRQNYTQPEREVNDLVEVVQINRRVDDISLAPPAQEDGTTADNTTSAPAEQPETSKAP